MQNKKPNRLIPINDIEIIEYDKRLTLKSNEVTAERVGLKAFGLSSLPERWSIPFIVVSCNNPKRISNLIELLKDKSFDKFKNLIVRSSGVNESIMDRGSLESKVCTLNSVIETLTHLRNDLNSKELTRSLVVHWIIQPYLPYKEIGHLSNERRISKAARDWIVEIDGKNDINSAIHSISLRKWRDNRPLEISELTCEFDLNYIDSLKPVANWATQKGLRLHFEWIIENNRTYIVQADECDLSNKGVSPIKLVKHYDNSGEIKDLNYFKKTEEKDYKNYRKLHNAKIYKKIGYGETPFYILHDKEIIDNLLINGVCDENLYSDLIKLTSRPLVLRTDGKNIPPSKKEMLPRSDELRNSEDARNWLINTFRNKILESNLSECEICLIGHHFIPAVASAWCLAYPDKRKVRIESLWGIPEGLYWYPHDVYDVDTRIQGITFSDKIYQSFKTNVRLRYKEKFIAPNDQGQWVLHFTSNQFDWKGSIINEDWVKTIAATSRKIAAEENEPVVVMWFIGVSKEASSNPILPWYHDKWQENYNRLKAAPNKNKDTDPPFKIKTRSDWLTLQQIAVQKNNIKRVLVDPTEPELVRDQKFSLELAEFVKKRNITVELSGGILSHAYYILTKHECNVECIDLYAIKEEEAEFNKLVRDKIPELINSHGEDVKLTKLKGDALIASLKRKIVEEALEVHDSRTTDEVIEEIADLQETINALQRELKISKKTVESRRVEKNNERGSFINGIMLTQTALKPAINTDFLNEKNLTQDISAQKYEKVISRSELLPIHSHDFNADSRFDQDGNIEKQLSFNVPIFENSALLPNSYFYLTTKNNIKERFIISLTMERSGGISKFKIRIKSTPEQLTLDL